MDSFSETVPQFNINGETHVNTFCGGVVTFLILMAALAYAANNAIELVDPVSPQINKGVVAKYFSNTREEATLLRESNFKLAFTLNDYYSGEPINDPRYIRWEAVHFYIDADFSRHYKTLPFHECNETDYAQFNPVASEQVEDMENLKKKGLWCLDDLPEDFSVGGSYQSSFNSEVGLMFFPCHVRGSAIFENSDDVVSEECIPDLEA